MYAWYYHRYIIWEYRVVRCTYINLSSDDDQPVSTLQNQSTNANCIIDKYINKIDSDECDLLDADIENQMGASMQ